MQRGRQMAGDHDRVDALLRPSAVGAFAGDGDVEECAAGVAHALAGGDLADRQAGRVVQAIDAVARETREQAIPQHRLRPAQALLGGLEDEVDGAVEGPGFRQVLSRAQQHRGVAVMAAGMHQAGVLAGVRQVGRLLDRQGVHVGAQADGGLAVAVAQHADHAGLADAAMHLDAPFLQLLGHQVGRAVFLHADFRMGVDVAPYGGEFRLIGTGKVEGVLRHTEDSGSVRVAQHNTSPLPCQGGRGLVARQEAACISTRSPRAPSRST